MIVSWDDHHDPMLGAIKGGYGKVLTKGSSFLCVGKNDGSVVTVHASECYEVVWTKNPLA